MLALLAAIGGDHGCLLVLEDLQWADPDTLDLVAYLAGVVSGAPVLLALTARDDVVLPGTARLTAVPGLTAIALRRLDGAGVAALAAACRGGAAPAGADLRELVARSDGLPFLVEELLGAASSQVPPTLAGLVAGRLAALPAAARPLLVAAAIAGGDPDWRLVGAVTDAPQSAVLGALRAAADVGLLAVEEGRLRWRHALTATLLPPERAALAARAAHVLDARGEPGDREAAAGLYVEGGDSERGAEVLVELARADTARGALRSAAQLLALAAATGAPAGPVVAERVRVLTLLGRAAEALELGEAALRTVRGDEHVALFGLGAHEHGEGDPSAPSLAAARELALEAGLLVHVVQADLIGANAVLLVDGPAAAVPLLREAAARAGRLRLTGLQAMAELFMAADSALVADLPAMTGSLAAAVSRPDAPTEVVTLGPMVRALPYLMHHDLPRASALFDEAIPALLAHGSAIPIDHIGLWALLRTAVGDRDRAARETLRENRSLSTAGNRAALGYADAIAAGRAGRPDAAVALFAEAGATIARFPWWNRLLRLLALEAAVVDGWDDPVPALRVDLAAHEAAGEENLARTCRDLLRAAGAPTRRRGAPVAPALRAHGITGREAEVLALVVTGLTNAETAERLYLSSRTVETHVARLLAKTGCADRAQLRRWAGETVATGKDRDR